MGLSISLVAAGTHWFSRSLSSYLIENPKVLVKKRLRIPMLTSIAIISAYGWVMINHRAVGILSKKAV